MFCQNERATKLKESSKKYLDLHRNVSLSSLPCAAFYREAILLLTYTFMSGIHLVIPARKGVISMWPYHAGKAYLDRLPHDADLLISIKESLKKSNVTMGFFVALGAVKFAKVAFYGQEDHTYHEYSIDEPAEILNCTGNVSKLDGEIFVHAHITLGLEDGTAKGGHLVEGTKIFACELFVIPLDGDQLKRTFDEVTGLKLWKP